LEPAYLLDEHISPLAASLLSAAGIAAEAVAGSPQAGSDDETVLRHAAMHGRILATHDISDLMVLQDRLLREGLDLPGIVFVDGRRFRTSEPAKLAKALRRLALKIRAGEASPEGGLFLTG
jgi:predicted nuclease of predicted toxin-antitoxin system